MQQPGLQPSAEEIEKFLEKREVEENDLDDAFAGRLEKIRGKLAGEGKDGKKHDLSKKKLEQMKHAADGNGGYLSYWL